MNEVEFRISDERFCNSLADKYLPNWANETVKRTHGPLPSEIRIRRRGEGASAVAILSIINRAATRPHTENLVGNC